MKISIVIPAKDEQHRLPSFLKSIAEYCKRSSHAYEVIVVDDGSKDATVQEIWKFKDQIPKLNVISLERNHGKGFAVKTGFLKAEGDIVLFLDADGSTAPDEIERHLDLFDQGFDIVIGSRALTDTNSKVKTKAYRKWIGSVFNFLVSSLLIKGIKDTQCGFKMFRMDVAKDIFSRLQLEGFGFDLEVLYLARKSNYRIKEVSVNWTHVDGSKVHMIKDSLRMFYNILEIKSKHSR